MVIFLKEPFSKNKADAEIIKNQLKLTKLEEFVDRVQVIYDPDIKKSKIEEDNKFIADFFKYHPDVKNLPVMSNWIIRVTLNRTKMLYGQMRMNLIREKLQQNSELFVITSNDNAEKLVVRIYFVINNMPDSNVNNVDQIMKYKDTILMDYTLRGVPGLTNVSIREDKTKKKVNKETGAIEPDPEFYLDTDGTNLSEVLKHPKVSIARTVCTDINEVVKTFGIEATRQVLLNELRNVFTSNGIYINYHHLGLLVDTMCRAGELTSISRHGFDRLDKSPISKTSFEETPEQLRSAALYAEEDNMKSVSAKIMFGHTIEGGSGMPKLIVDETLYGIAQSDIDEIMGI